MKVIIAYVYDWLQMKLVDVCEGCWHLEAFTISVCVCVCVYIYIYIYIYIPLHD